MEHPSLVVAVSSRVLFDSEDAHEAYETGGLDAFARAVRDKGEILEPGVGFHALKALVDVAQRNGVTMEVVVVSRRDAEAGLPIVRSIEHHGIPSVKGAFTDGSPDIVPYLQAFGAQLFLSRSESDVQAAIDAGIPAARLTGSPKAMTGGDGMFRIAFDGDAVLFSEDSEMIFREHGLDAFNAHEAENAGVPLPDGPMAPFFRTLREIEEKAGARLFRTALITARTGPARERAMRTLASWGCRVDEAMFCGFTPKKNLIEAFKPHLFFDDNIGHLELADHLVASGHVPWPSR